MALDIPAIALKAVNTAFGVAASLLRAATVTHVVASGSYNPATGAYTSTNTTAEVKALFSNFNVKQVDGEQVLFGDSKIFIKNSELGDLVISRDDYLTETVSGVRWDVVDYRFEATSNLWIIQGRRSKT